MGFCASSNGTRLNNQRGKWATGAFLCRQAAFEDKESPWSSTAKWGDCRRNGGNIASSAVLIHPFSYGSDKLLELSLFELEEKSEVETGSEKLCDDPEKLFLGDVLSGPGRHGVYSTLSRPKGKAHNRSPWYATRLTDR